MKGKVKSLSKCLTLRDPMDYSLPGSSVHGIFQVRVLEWVAIAFSDPEYTSYKRSPSDKMVPTLQAKLVSKFLW